MERGISEMIKGPDKLAQALGADVASSAKRWDHEILYHGYLRRWADLMNGHVG